MRTRILLISLLINFILSPVFSQTLDVSTTAINLSATSANSSFNITSNTSWYASANFVWLNVNGLTSYVGSNNETITVTATDNPKAKARTASIYIFVGANIVKTISVTQAGVNPTLSVSTNAISIGASENSTATFSVSSNATWTLSHSDATWMYINNFYGTYSWEGDLTLNLTANKNLNIFVRRDTLSISVPGLPVQKVVVTQDAFVPALSVSTTALSIDAIQLNTVTFDVTSNATWTVNHSDKTSWLFLNSISGPGAWTGNKTNTLTANSNLSNSVRRDTLSISVTGLPVQKIVVTQKSLATLSVSANAISIAPAPDSKAYFTVNSTILWTLSHSDKTNWLLVNNYAGNGSWNGKVDLTLTASENRNNSVRTDTLSITAPDMPLYKVIVTQAAPTLSVSSNSLSVAASASSTTSLSVYSNAKWTLNHSDKTNWLTLSGAPVTTLWTGDTTLNFVATANPKLSIRRDTLSIMVTGLPVQKIVVSQDAAAPVLSVSANTVSLPANAGTIENVFSINSNTTWTISSTQSWITASPGSGSNNSNITLTITANPNTTNRNATITVSSAGVTSQTITVTQTSEAATLSVNTNTLNIAEAEGSTATFNVSSNTLWTISCSQPWLTLSSTSGSNNSTITLTASVNPNNSSRTANITVAITGGTTQTITITQNATIPALVNKVNDTEDNTIYPNPVQDEAFICFSPEDIPATLLIYNNNGCLLQKTQINSSLTTVSMEGYLPGIYIIQIQTPLKRIEKKLIKL
jgi:hypothetical protein